MGFVTERRVIELLALGIVSVSGLVLLGQVLNLPWLTRFSADPSVDTKWATAIAGLSAGMSLFAGLRQLPDQLYWFGGIILGSMLAGFGNLFHLMGEEFQSVGAGVPSWFTLLGHALHVSVLLRLAQMSFDYVFTAGVAISLIGVSGFLGHVFDRPLMYGYVEGWSTAMAMPTSIMFIMLGAAVVTTYDTFGDLQHGNG